MRYQIQGDTLPVVICQLEAGERMITEGGGMSWMSPNMKMEATVSVMRRLEKLNMWVPSCTSASASASR